MYYPYSPPQLTVAEAMRNFLRDINPTEAQERDISVSHVTIRDVLADEFSVNGHFLAGSYARSTMLRQSRDVDLFVVLDSSDWFGSATRPGYGFQLGGPVNLLRRVRGRLVTHPYYRKSEISRDGQAVAVRLAHVNIDVVPVFRTEQGYLVPDGPRGEWLHSNPLGHADAVQAANARHGGRFVPLVKALKHWNAIRPDNRLSGFFLEMWAIDVFRYHDLPDLGTGIYVFFDNAVEYLDHGWTVPDPGGTEVNLMAKHLVRADQRMSQRIRMARAREVALLAIQDAACGRDWAAIIQWRKLFGDPFPVRA